MTSRGPLQRCLASLGRGVGRRPLVVLAVMLLVTLAAAYPAIRTVFNVEQDLIKVLSAGMPRAEAYKEIAQQFGIIDRHFVVLHMEDEDDLSDAKELADRLAELLAADPEMVRSARARHDLAGFIRTHAHLYLDEELAGELAARFSDEGLRRAMDENRERLRLGLGDVVRADPLDLRSLLPRIAAKRGGGQARAFDPEGYLVSPDGRMLLLDVRPAASGGNQAFARKLMDYTRDCIARARSEVFTADRAEAGRRIRTEIGGAYAMSQSMGRLIGEGIRWSAATSFLLIVCLFALVYLRPGAFFFIGLPLALPVIWTLAVVPLPMYVFGYEGRMSIIGGAFCAVLLGLGVDYAIHIYNRYVSERAGGASPVDAAETGVAATGEGIVVGAMTTVVAFLGMTLTQFRGFKEFGTIAGIGVFLTMAALLVCMPAALVVLSRVLGPRERGRTPFSFGLSAALRAVRARPRTIIAACLVLFVVCLLALLADPNQLGVNFESDMGKMGPPARLDPVGELNRRISESFGMDYKQISVVLEADGAEEALERTAELRRRALGARLVKSVRDITMLVPPPSAQQRSLELARSLPLADLPRRLYAASEAAGLYRAPAYRDFVKVVEEMSAAVRAGTLLDVGNLSDPLVAELAGFMFCAPRGGSGKCHTHTMVSLNSYAGLENDDYDALGRELGVDNRTVSMTNHVLITYELKDSVRDDMILATGIVAAVVVIMLTAALRRPTFVLLSVSPVLLGTAYMMTLMKTIGWVNKACGSDFVLELNYINILVYPVLIGIGVDNAVHLIIRARQDGLDVSGAVTETGRALVLCSLTTMLGFLSLTTCAHWGIRSLGIVVAIGMGFVMLISVLFVPAVLEVLRRRAERASQGGSP